VGCSGRRVFLGSDSALGSEQGYPMKEYRGPEIERDETDEELVHLLLCGEPDQFERRDRVFYMKGFVDEIRKEKRW
jgi:hypothetical protein